MDRTAITRILQMYGVTWRTILPPQKGYRNTTYPVVTANNTLNLIIYKQEPGMSERVRHINATGAFLHAKSLPVRYPQDARVLRLGAPGREAFAGLYNYLPGQTIPWEAYTMERIKNLGKAMGDMHALLAAYPDELPLMTGELLALNQRMRRYFDDPQVAKALASKLSLRVEQNYFATLLLFCQKQPAQALHMDFVRGNILFKGDTITGILDFEKAGKGTPAFDIARTLAFLYVDCKYKPEDKVRKYFAISGYHKRSASSFAKWQLVDRLVPFFLLHDFYKFLRHNPYEFLPQNEHFIRTKAMLLKHGILTLAHVK